MRRPIDEEGTSLILEKDKDRFMFGRSGDHLVTPFQCETCHFRNILGRDIQLESGQDRLLVIAIRRASLDSFWSRESSTVQGTATGVRTIATKLEVVGVDSKLVLPPMGPHPLEDTWGMGIAVAMLLRSLDPGENEDTIQWGTVRKLRSSFSNVWRASVKGPRESVLQLDTVKMYITSCPTNSYWFERFANGVHRRQGDMVKPDLGLSLEQMVVLMSMFEKEWVNSPDPSEAGTTILFAALFMLVSYLGGLRGEEVPLLDLGGMIKYFQQGVSHPKHPHVPLALLGRFKHDGRERYHYVPISAREGSPLVLRPWIERMFKYYQRRGITNGRVFRNVLTGTPSKQGDYEFEFLRRMSDIQSKTEGIVPTTDNVFEDYGTRRSARRGATTEARNLGLAQDTIEENNRWSQEERSKGKKSSGSMLMHYTEVRLSVGKLVMFSDTLLEGAESTTAYLRQGSGVRFM